MASRSPSNSQELYERHREYQRRYRETHKNERAAYAREYASRNVKALRERRKGYYERNRDSILERTGQYYQKNKQKMNDASFFWGIRDRYGVTKAQYLRMVMAQGGRCLICGEKPSGKFRRLAVDHDHNTGEVQGLLCCRCNRAIGLLGDSHEVLDRAAKYLWSRSTNGKPQPK